MSELKKVRTEMGISQLELAARCAKEGGNRLSRWIIQLVESGYREPSNDEVVAISRALGAKPKELFPNKKSKNIKKPVIQRKSA